MLRGINKQIIEIKCPNDENFEKILLFVKGEKSNLPMSYLTKQATGYADAVVSSYGNKENNSRKKKLAFGLSVVALAVVIMVVATLLIF